MRLLETTNTILAIIGGIFLDTIRVKSGREIQRELNERQYKAAAEREKRLLDSKMYEIDIMTGKEFEKLLSLIFEKLDYDVQLTSQTQDYGADLILYKDGITIVVQAKRKKAVVGVSAVQEVVSAIGYYQADKGMVVTNNYFTRYAYNLARSNEIELWDRKRLINFMHRVKTSSLATENGNFS